MRVLAEQWQQMLPPDFVGRDVELRALLDALRRPGSIVELIAQTGMGKTALLKKLATDKARNFSGAIEYFVGSRTFPLTEAVDAIAARLSAASGHSLLVIDDADELNVSDTLEGINRLSTGPWTLSTVLASHQRLGLGTKVELPPFSEVDFASLLHGVFGEELDARGMEGLWIATRGNPKIARLLGDYWRSGKAPDLSALTALLEPWRTSGLRGPNGQPLCPGGIANHRIVTDVRQISLFSLVILGRAFL